MNNNIKKEIENGGNKMKKSVKLLLVLSLLLITLLAACGTSEDNKAGSGDSEGKEILVMGTSADYPPYEYIDTAKGEEIIGFDVDIANYIADQLGFELQIKDMDFGGLVPALTNERVDFVLAGMTPTEERLENVDFSEIYYVAQQMIVTKEGNEITSLEDLKGKKLGVQLGSIQVDLANDIAEEVGDVEVLERNKITDLIQELKANRIDAAVIEDKVAEGHLNANSDLTAFVIVEEGEAGSAIAFPKGSELKDQFNEVLQEMFDNGKMEELIEKWFRSED